MQVYKDNIKYWAKLVFVQAGCFIAMDALYFVRGKLASGVMMSLLHLGYFYAGCKFLAWTAKDTRKTRSGIGRAMRILLFVSCLIWFFALCMSISVIHTYTGAG